MSLHQFGACVLLIPLTALTIVGLAAMVLDLLNGE